MVSSLRRLLFNTLMINGFHLPRCCLVQYALVWIGVKGKLLINYIIKIHICFKLCGISLERPSVKLTRAVRRICGKIFTFLDVISILSQQTFYATLVLHSTCGIFATGWVNVKLVGLMQLRGRRYLLLGTFELVEKSKSWLPIFTRRNIRNVDEYLKQGSEVNYLAQTGFNALRWSSSVGLPGWPRSVKSAIYSSQSLLWCATLHSWADCQVQ